MSVRMHITIKMIMMTLMSTNMITVMMARRKQSLSLSTLQLLAPSHSPREPSSPLGGAASSLAAHPHPCAVVAPLGGVAPLGAPPLQGTDVALLGAAAPPSDAARLGAVASPWFSLLLRLALPRLSLLFAAPVARNDEQWKLD